MKKGRFILIVLGVILVAPPLASLFIWIVTGGYGFSLFGSGPRYNVEALINNYIPYSYYIGLFPSCAVAAYGAWMVWKRMLLHRWRAYIIGFNAFYANLAAIVPPDKNMSVDFFSATLLALTVAFMTPTFLILYFVVKKLLPWAGTSLIEPTKAGTP